MVDPSDLITALQGLITQPGGRPVPGPQGSPAAFGAGRAPTIYQALPSYWGPEQFTGGTRPSGGVIDLGPTASSCVIYVQPLSGSATTPQATITVTDGATPNGPFRPGIDASATIQTTGTGNQ